jgi:hypothetical protein
MPDGLWAITMPVPRSQVDRALTNLFQVLSVLEQQLGIFYAQVVEVNASGKCHVSETETILASLHIPDNYVQCVISPLDTPFRHGHFTRINDNFGCYRIRYGLTAENFARLKSIVMTLAESQAVIYR